LGLLAVGLPPPTEAAAHDLAEIRTGGRDHELHRRLLIAGDRTQIVIEQRQRVAVVLEGHAERATHVRDRLIGVFTDPWWHRLFHFRASVPRDLESCER